MTEEFESARSFEDIVKDFIANYEIYSTNLQDTGVISSPDELFKYFEMPGRERLLNAVAAYYSLPESIGERKRLIDEALRGSPLIPESARQALTSFAVQQQFILTEIGQDWRNVIAERLIAWKIAHNEKEALEKLKSFPEELQKKMDVIVKYVPPTVGERKPQELLRLVNTGKQYSLITPQDAARLKTYLEEFIMTSTDKRF